MKSLPFSALHLSAGLALLLTFISCSTTDEVRLTDDDRTAVNKIYEISPWVVRQSKLDLQARDGGVVEINLEAEATPKGQATGPVWLPLLFVRELPQYFHATDLTTKKSIELESYRVPGGLWLITAVIPETRLSALSATQGAQPITPSPTPMPSSSPTETPGVKPLGSATSDAQGSPATLETHPVAISLGVTMISPRYSTGFPFLLSAGQGHSAVETSVTLPKGSKFLTLQVKDTDTSASRSPRFTVLPSSVTGDLVTAAARLAPDSTTAWNFSGITYASSNLGVWRPWFLPSSALVVLGALALWWRIEQVRSYRKWLTKLKTRRRRLLVDVRHQLNQLISVDVTKLEIGKEFDKKWGRLLAEARHLLSREYIDDYILSWADDSVGQLLNELARNESSRLEKGLILVQLETVRSDFQDVKHLNERLLSLYSANQRSEIVSRVLLALVVVSMIWLLSIFARAQSPGPSVSNKPTVVRLATLGELGVNVMPQDPHSDKYDTVDVNLSFFPLTEVPGPQTFEEVGLGIGDNTKLRIDPVQLPANSPAKLIQETGRVVRITVPTSHAAVIQRWKALAEWRPVDFSATPDYLKSLDSASKVNLSYSIKGAQTVSERTQGRFFHWFPWDSVLLDLPLEFRQPAIVSIIELQSPSLDYVSNPYLEGLNTPLVEDESGRKYISVSKEKDGRGAIWANKPITIKAKFERPSWQQFGLTFGQLIVGLLIGVGVGFVMSAREKNWISVLVSGLGILGLPFMIRTVVLARYENLPSILWFQGITLFEVFFLVNIALMVLVSILTYKQRHKSNRDFFSQPPRRGSRRKRGN